jgi:TP901 family phage tail tape measure protein
MAALTVPTIFTAVDKLSSVISKMQGNVSKFASETQKKYAQMSRSAQEWQTNFSQIGMAAGIAGAAIIAPLGFAVKAASEFEDQMANVATLVDTTKESIKDMGTQVLDVFSKAPVKLDDLTEALYKIRSAGIPAAQAMDVLSKAAILGIAGRGTTLQAGDAITSAINVFKDEGLSTNKIASMLFETVKQGKTTIEGMSESFGATANIVHNGGVKLNDFLSATAAMTVMGEPATQAMNQIRASVFGLEKPTTRMKFLFKELGVKDVKDLVSKFGNLGNAMSAIEDKGKKLGVNMGQAWGKVGAYAAVIALTGNSKGAYNKNLLGMNNSDADLAAGYADKLNTMKAQSQLLQNEMQYFGIKVGTALLPVLVKLAKAIAPIVDWFGKWIDNNPRLAQVLIVTTAAIGALLLIIAPLAFMISGIAAAVKLWAGLNLWLAGSAETAAAGIAIQETAVAGIAGEFAVAEVAATGFFATLSAFALPAALVALSGLAIWKYMDEVDKGNKMLPEGGGYKPQSFNANSATGKVSPFSNQKEETAYQAWWLKGAQMTSSADTSLNRANFDRQHGKEYPALFDPAVFNSLNNPNNNTNALSHKINLNINDPGKHVGSVSSKGDLNIPATLNQKSTTGNK